MGLFAFCYILQDKKMQKNFYNNCDKNLILFTIIFAILLIFNNIVMQKAVETTPNIGYTRTLMNLNIILTLLVSYFIFKNRTKFYIVFFYIFYYFSKFRM